MKKTEEILKRQLLSAMQGGKNRILIHRTYTGNDDISQDGTTRSICRDGLKIFGDEDIYYSLSDFGNDIEIIMEQIKCANKYKASDKAFILSVPANALCYTPGNTVPILYGTNERNYYDKKCNVVLPQYVLGYVSVSQEGISSLQYNNEARSDVPTDRHYARSVLAQYREKNDQVLQSIRSDRFYTNEEKEKILKILYANHRDFLSRGAQRVIKHLMPETDLETRIMTASLDYNQRRELGRFLKRNENKKITKRILEEEFTTPKRLTIPEIMHVIPDLLNRENQKKSALTLEEMIDVVAGVYGFSKKVMTNLTMPKRTIKDKIRDLLHRRTKQKLLEEPKDKPKGKNELDKLDNRDALIEELGYNINQGSPQIHINNEEPNKPNEQKDEGRI